MKYKRYLWLILPIFINTAAFLIDVYYFKFSAGKGEFFLFFYIYMILIFLSIRNYSFLLSLVFSAAVTVFCLAYSIVYLVDNTLPLNLTLLLITGFFYSYYLKEHKEGAVNIVEIDKQYELYNEQTSKLEKDKQKHEILIQQLNQLDRLSKTGSICASSLNFDFVTEKIIEETRDILSVDDVILSFYDNDSGRFKVNKFSGNYKDVIDKQTDNLDEWVAQSEQPQLIKDLNKEFKIKLVRYSDFSSAFSIIAAPVKIKNKVAGVLRCESDTGNKFNESDLRILQYISDMASLSFENSKLYEETEKLAITDGITGLYVHFYFIEKLNEEILRSLNFSSKLTIILFDIDYFKRFNDDYGHQVGDLVLQKISELAKGIIREVDFAARYGGDEFAIILPETDIKGGKILANRLRESAENIVIEQNLSGQVKKIGNLSISLGVGEFKKEYKTETEFLKKVDTALYEAKNNGRNRVCEVTAT